jgi:hypothetical protein
MDEIKNFMTIQELADFNEEEFNTNLTPNNFNLERVFKLKVLDWLTNGKPKLFRSPAEGNYIVRLMNISLSPNTTVGRMLHTFSSTAYECMDLEYEKMLEHNLIQLPEDKFVSNVSTTYSTLIIGEYLR